MKGFFPAVVTAGVVTGCVIAAGAISRAFGLPLPEVPTLEVVTGAICLIWLLVILKYPWDLYFEARGVRTDLLRSRESGIAVAPAREHEVRSLIPKLLLLAIFAHVGSAALVGAVAYYSHGAVGYWFAVFYLISTAFRPAATGYKHLLARIRRLADEVRFPREDVLSMRGDVQRHTQEISNAAHRISQLEQALSHEKIAREAEERVLRDQLSSLGREFETTLARLTDNQDVIRGIQAFVRLIGRADPS